MAFNVLRVRDLGATKLLKNAASTIRVRVGVFGTTKHEGTELTIAQLLEIHELGLGVPERSILRAWAEQNEAAIQNDMRAAFRKMLLGKFTPEQAAKILGVRWVGQIQEFVRSGKVQPPLSQATIDKKGSSQPLIDTGQLVSAITFLVEKAVLG